MGWLNGPAARSRQPGGAGAAGVGMHAALAEFQQGFAVQRERLRDRVGAVGGVNDVIDDFQPVRVGDLAGAPGGEVVAVAVEHHHRGVLALEHIDAVLQVGRHPADQAEFFPVGEFEEVADQLVGVVACADLGHCWFLPRMVGAKDRRRTIEHSRPPPNPGCGTPVSLPECPYLSRARARASAPPVLTPTVWHAAMPATPRIPAWRNGRSNAPALPRRSRTSQTTPRMPCRPPPPGERGSWRSSCTGNGEAPTNS